MIAHHFFIYFENIKTCNLRNIKNI